MVEPHRPSGGRAPLVVANLAALALLIASGLVHGRLTDRWGTSTALIEATARLDRVPRSIGDWQGQDLAIDQRQIDRAGIRGYLSRSYRNTRDGRELTVLLVCGRPGPIAVHTPDVCYEGAGYEAESSPVAEDVATAGGPPARFLKARFLKVGSAETEALDIRWAWNAQGSWEVPGNPRVAFAAHPFLYKLYVIARPDGLARPPSGGPPDDRESAGEILEAIDRALTAREDAGSQRPGATGRDGSGVWRTTGIASIRDEFGDTRTPGEGR